LACSILSFESYGFRIDRAIGTPYDIVGDILLLIRIHRLTADVDNHPLKELFRKLAGPLDRLVGHISDQSRRIGFDLVVLDLE